MSQQKDPKEIVICDAAELLSKTPNRQELLDRCVDLTAKNLFVQMEKVSVVGFKSIEENLYSFFSMGIKKEEESEMVTKIQKLFEDKGYKVSFPLKNKKDVNSQLNVNTILRISWE